MNPEQTLSVVIPVYNEKETILRIIAKVLKLDFVREVLVVDDGSTDGTRELLHSTPLDGRVKLFFHDRNRGKGAALRTGFGHVAGEIVAIQDADLEYDPNEFIEMIKPILEGVADVVYGSRLSGGRPQRVHLFWHYVGNRLLTILSNMFTNLNLTDMETCYKLFRREILQQIQIQENGFGIEPELTAKVAKMGCRIYEVGISYYGRSYREGKKVTWKDGLKAIWVILKYGFFD